MVLKPCAEGEDLAKYGADCSGCMTVHTFETALNSRLEVSKEKKNQRNWGMRMSFGDRYRCL